MREERLSNAQDYMDIYNSCTHSFPWLCNHCIANSSFCQGNFDAFPVNTQRRATRRTLHRFFTFATHRNGTVAYLFGNGFNVIPKSSAMLRIPIFYNAHFLFTPSKTLLIRSNPCLQSVQYCSDRAIDTLVHWLYGNTPHRNPGETCRDLWL